MWVSSSGSGSLTKSGSGQVIFQNSTANSYGGPTIVNAGLLQLDFRNAPSPPLIEWLYGGSTTNALIMNGGQFETTSRPDTTTLQFFSGCTLRSGSSIIDEAVRQSNNHPGIYLGNITRTNAGATVDLTPSTGSSGSLTDGTTGIFTSTTNNSPTGAGILGGYATLNGGTEWARMNTSSNSGQAHI